MTLTIGIDPGQRGAVAILDTACAVELLADLPCISDKSLTWIDGRAEALLIAAYGRRTAAKVAA